MEEMRLQKYFTDCGIMSRRAAEKEIADGKVKVNGAVAELGQKIDPSVDKVYYKGKLISPKEDDKKIYIILNKPRGFVTTMSDEKGRATVCELVSSLGERVYPVGRLDMDSDGLLLMTNDGELANMLTHPRHEIPKIYHVTVVGKVTPSQLSKLSSPLLIDGYEIMPVTADVICVDEKSTVLKMTLYEGRNRQIRKMCEQCSLEITRLSRVAIGNIDLGELKSGEFRHLREDEVLYLKSSGKII